MKQGLTDENYEALISYRMQRSHETLAEVPFLKEQGFFNTATNRLYYACYYAAVALLLKHRITTETHAGVKSKLGLHFVATGKISKESGRAFTNIFDCRQRGDYDDYYYSSKEEVEELFPKAKRFIEEVEALLRKEDAKQEGSGID